MSTLDRRSFLQLSALALGVPPSSLPGAATARRVSIVLNDHPATSTAPVRWAVGELRAALVARGFDVIVDVVRPSGLEDTSRPSIVVGVLDPAFENGPETVILRAADGLEQPHLFACGGDARGAMYAVLELAERVAHATDVQLRHLPSLVPKSVRESPANGVRAIGRPFVSDVEDKPWYYDRAFWPEYFGMLARHRINRFHFSLGFGYDTLRWVTDAYMLFPYPFLVAVPGHDVRAVNLPDAERDKNLETLKYISDQAVAHGIDFQLGLWTHGYTWQDSPSANYTIAGISPANHAAYCRDALAAVLRACPSVTGVTLRTHYESGVKEGSYAFWRTIFEGAPLSGRTLEMELHVKGLDQKMVDAALATGLPVRLSGKYWAEHTGLPYHQTAIRELELPKPDPADDFSALSFGSRNHTRYGYADFLSEDRSYGFMFRVFPGTHKFLLWGDPVTMAAHARAFGFCGSQGAELLEPLAFKGRRGSGLAGGRTGYRDQSLDVRPDWKKYLYTYALWGRLLYNPDSAPATWRRLLRREYGGAAPALESALGAATRILPLVTTAHAPSAAQDTYSPEFYTNHSIVDPEAPSPYGDTPEPKTFTHVSPLDPEIFAAIDEWAASVLDGKPVAKYSPIEVAHWLDGLAARASASLAEAERVGGAAHTAAIRLAGVDIRMQAGMGRFFAAKLRSGALYAIYQRSGSREALEAAAREYRAARAAWARLAADAAKVYAPDITFGPLPHQRGHWQDRLAAIDADIAAMEKTLASASGAEAPAAARRAVSLVLHRVQRPASSCRHAPPAQFVPGAPLELSLAVDAPAPTQVLLHYRRVNQAERYETLEMRLQKRAYVAAVPAAFTESRFPLQYYFEVRRPGGAVLFPGLGKGLTTQPYFVVRKRTR
jgi:hypothetical protein